MLWTLEERTDGLIVPEYTYFERDEPLVFDCPGTYVNTEVTFTQNVTHNWNHGLGEIVTALLDSVPWEALRGQMTRIELDEWRLTDRPWRLAHSYTLQAIKRA